MADRPTGASTGRDLSGATRAFDVRSQRYSLTQLERSGDSPAHSEIDQNIAANIRHLRERRGISQTALAKTMDEAGFPWHQTTVSRVEAADRPVQFAEAYALAKILHVSVDALAGPPDDQKLLDELVESCDRALRALESLHEGTVALIQAQSEIESAVDLLRKARYSIDLDWEFTPDLSLGFVLKRTPEQVVLDARRDYEQREARHEGDPTETQDAAHEAVEFVGVSASDQVTREVQDAVKRALSGELTLLNRKRLANADISTLYAYTKANGVPVRSRDRGFLILPKGTRAGFYEPSINEFPKRILESDELVMWKGKPKDRPRRDSLY